MPTCAVRYEDQALVRKHRRSGTRDAYNPYDFAQLIAGVDEGSGTSEMELNCMGWAGD